MNIPHDIVWGQWVSAVTFGQSVESAAVCRNELQVNKERVDT